MSRMKGRHSRRLAAAPSGGAGKTIPVYVTQSEWDRLSAVAAERGISTALLLKRAGLAQVQAHELHTSRVGFDPDGPQPLFP